MFLSRALRYFFAGLIFHSVLYVYAQGSKDSSQLNKQITEIDYKFTPLYKGRKFISFSIDLKRSKDIENFDLLRTDVNGRRNAANLKVESGFFIEKMLP
ncbi:MAG: hypothetical protein MUE33_05065 [Cytophagaceae bacterium]|jgi:hypothetical protein|nr:hypothetical protein [Cytophagaceae bacterium]